MVDSSGAAVASPVRSDTWWCRRAAHRVCAEGMGVGSGMFQVEDCSGWSARRRSTVDCQRWWRALGLANLAAILDVGVFVIGGGLSIAADLVLPATRSYLADLVEGHEAR